MTSTDRFESPERDVLQGSFALPTPTSSTPAYPRTPSSSIYDLPTSTLEAGEVWSPPPVSPHMHGYVCSPTHLSPQMLSMQQGIPGILIGAPMPPAWALPTNGHVHMNCPMDRTQPISQRSTVASTTSCFSSSCSDDVNVKCEKCQKVIGPGENVVTVWEGGLRRFPDGGTRDLYRPKHRHAKCLPQTKACSNWFGPHGKCSKGFMCPFSHLDDSQKRDNEARRKEERMHEFTEELAAKERQLAAKDTHLTMQDDKLTELDTQLTKQNERFSALEAEKSQLEKELDAKSVTLDELDRQLAAKDALLTKQNEKLTEIKTEKGQLEKELEAKTGTLDDQNAQLKEKFKELRSLEKINMLLTMVFMAGLGAMLHSMMGFSGA